MLVGNLSDETETYTVRAGLETNNFGTVNDGVFFRYTHSVNSGNWICVTRRSGVETVTNTVIAPTTLSYTKFQILINSAGTSVQFLINNVLVATHVDNIPTSAGYSIGILKSLGITTRFLYVSPFQYIQTLNTPY
jgi:multidrug transporter EmrE-like cation transporter